MEQFSGLVICPYCGGSAKLVGGNVIYPHRSDLAGKTFWSCKPCGAYVGCYGGNKHIAANTPLGRLADRELRSAKMSAHRAFDPLWQGGRMTRDQAYSWLCGQLGLTLGDCHIGMFDVSMCRQVVEVCEAYWRENPQGVSR